MFRAGRTVPHYKKCDCHALPLFALDRAISSLFSISVLKQARPNGCAKSLQKFAKNHDTTKGRKDDTNIHVLSWGGPPLRVQLLHTFPTPKWASNEQCILRILRFLAGSSGVTKCKNLNEPSTQLSEFQILFAPSTNRSHKAQNQVS